MNYVSQILDFISQFFEIIVVGVGAVVVFALTLLWARRVLRVRARRAILGLFTYGRLIHAGEGSVQAYFSSLELLVRQTMPSLLESVKFSVFPASAVRYDVFMFIGIERYLIASELTQDCAFELRDTARRLRDTLIFNAMPSGIRAQVEAAGASPASGVKAAA